MYKLHLFFSKNSSQKSEVRLIYLTVSGWNSAPKKPKIWYNCNHFEQYSAARPYFHDIIPSKEIFLSKWLLTSLLTATLVKLLLNCTIFEPNTRLWSKKHYNTSSPKVPNHVRNMMEYEGIWRKWIFPVAHSQKLVACGKQAL